VPCKASTWLGVGEGGSPSLTLWGNTTPPSPTTLSPQGTQIFTAHETANAVGKSTFKIFLALDHYKERHWLELKGHLLSEITRVGDRAGVASLDRDGQLAWP